MCIRDRAISGEGLSAAEQYALREEREHKNTGDYTDKPGQQFENWLLYTSVNLEGEMAWWKNDGKHRYYQVATISPEGRWWFGQKQGSPWHGHYLLSLIHI